MQYNKKADIRNKKKYYFYLFTHTLKSLSTKFLNHYSQLFEPVSLYISIPPTINPIGRTNITPTRTSKVFKIGSNHWFTRKWQPWKGWTICLPIPLFQGKSVSSVIVEKISRFCRHAAARIFHPMSDWPNRLYECNLD